MSEYQQEILESAANFPYICSLLSLVASPGGGAAGPCPPPPHRRLSPHHWKKIIANFCQKCLSHSADFVRYGGAAQPFANSWLRH